MSDLVEGASPPAVSRRLPGRARRRADVLREYEEFNAERRKRIPAPLWPFFAPDPAQYFRWHVQLDCTCITELMTPDDQTPPSERRWRAPGNGEALPAGQLYCHHDDSGPAQYRTIVEWRDRREIDFPPDPVEPPEWIADADTWSKIRHDEPRTSAFWHVLLDCGHVEDAVATDLEWRPDDGPRLVDATRLKRITEEWERLCASDPTCQPEYQREHMRRMLTVGWPMPRPEQPCYTCPHARQIIAYQRVGRLVPRDSKPWPERWARPSRVALERQLSEAEAQAKRLRAQLAQHDEREGV